MAIKVPNQENRAFTNYTFGDTANVNQQRLLQNLIGLKEQRETREFREKQFEASEDYKYETLGLKKREISGAEAFRAKQLRIREDDKIRQDKIRLEDLGFKKQLQTTSDEIKKIAIENQTSTNLYRQSMLDMKKTELNRQSQSLYGGNIFDDKGDMFKAVIKNKDDEFIRNPKIPVGVKVDVKEKRIIPVTEIAMNQKAENMVDQKLGILKGAEDLKKLQESSSYVLDPLLTDSEESAFPSFNLPSAVFGGKRTAIDMFDEEDALDNLRGKTQSWASAVSNLKVRDKTNPERKALLSNFIKLKKELEGPKYASATSPYAINKKKYGAVKKALADQVQSHINTLKK